MGRAGDLGMEGQVGGWIERMRGGTALRVRFSEWLFLLWAALFFRGICFGELRAETIREVVFAAYNVENYRVSAGVGVRAKSEQSREAVAEVVSGVRPDILGLCEMGPGDAVEDLRGRLERRGIRFEEVESVEGADPERRLVLLSRFPIVGRGSRGKVPYELEGRPFLMRRGILDVRVRVGEGYEVRLVGAHLKSKLPVPEGEALIRRMEAQLLRRHIDGILECEPRVNLLVYGDLNDTKEQAPIRELVGVWGGEGGLRDLVPEDDVGDRWTHYWKQADLYSRIDYLLVSRGLWPEVMRGSPRIVRSGPGRAASDHRMVWFKLRPVD